MGIEKYNSNSKFFSFKPYHNDEKTTKSFIKKTIKHLDCSNTDDSYLNFNTSEQS